MPPALCLCRPAVVDHLHGAHCLSHSGAGPTPCSGPLWLPLAPGADTDPTWPHLIAFGQGLTKKGREGRGSENHVQSSPLGREATPCPAGPCGPVLLQPVGCQTGEGPRLCSVPSLLPSHPHSGESSLCLHRGEDVTLQPSSGLPSPSPCPGLLLATAQAECTWSGGTLLPSPSRPPAAASLTLSGRHAERPSHVLAGAGRVLTGAGLVWRAEAGH